MVSSKEYQRNWRKKNIKKFRTWKKKYYQENKEKMLQERKEYREKNKDKIKIYRKKYYQENKEINSKKNKIWNKSNKEKSSGYSKKSSKKYSEKIKSRNETNRKIKIPKNQLCQMCNKNLAIHKHHLDYSKPLEIKSLCSNCHIKLHRGRW